MTLDEMEQLTRQSDRVTLTFPRGTKKPAGFPRGELLMERADIRVYSFPSDKLLKWIEKVKHETEEQ